MAKYLIITLISCLGLSAFAEAFPGHLTGDRSGSSSRRHDRYRQPTRGTGNWVCSADNMIQKGFMGESSDKARAMEEAMARCEASSQLPCYKIECRRRS